MVDFRCIPGGVFHLTAAGETTWYDYARYVVAAAQIAGRTLRLEPSRISPIPAAQRTVGQKAAVTFGNLADIGKALRAARKARREDIEQQAESFQYPMFDLRGSSTAHRARCSHSAPGKLCCSLTARTLAAGTPRPMAQQSNLVILTEMARPMFAGGAPPESYAL